MYDLDKIKDSVDMEDLADHLGIEYKPVRNRKSILCPFHGDEHFGSAVIKNNKICCYVCGHPYDIFDVWQYFRGCTLEEAASQIVKEFGLYGCEASREDKMPFSRREMETIGLCKRNDPWTSKHAERYPIGYGKPVKEKKYVYVLDNVPGGFSDDYVRVRKGNSQMQHLRKLYIDDRDAFTRLVISKCNETFLSLRRSYLVLRALYYALMAEKPDGQQIRDSLTEFLMWRSLEEMEAVFRVHTKLKGL